MWHQSIRFSTCQTSFALYSLLIEYVMSEKIAQNSVHSVAALGADVVIVGVNGRTEMPTKVTLYPIYALADTIDGEPFDVRIFPFTVIEGITVEDVRPMFNTDTFAWVRSELGRHDLETLQRIRYALVHRYVADQHGIGGESDAKSKKLIR